MGEQQPERARRTRRAVLAAAAGSAAAMAATAISAPASVLGHDVDDVQKGTDNPTTAATLITNSHGTADTPDQGFVGVSTGLGTGLHGFSGDTGATPDDPVERTGVLGTAAGVSGFGVTGFGDFTDSFNTVGVFGSGDNGVIGEGYFGTVGVGHFGVQGFTTLDDPGAVGVFAEAAATNQYALQAIGRVKFSRSGRVLLGSSKSSVKVTLAAVTSATHVFAQIGSLRPGYYIASVVPTTGSFTVYLNKALTQGTYIHWMVLDA
ncbi:MAG: hypothetical protein E6I45_06385 [Chloroflexi bacterium]|nr:MAG: hypothetical protein E6I45_06385 [Chloroflexota bacterium]